MATATSDKPPRKPRATKAAATTAATEAAATTPAPAKKAAPKKRAAPKAKAVVAEPSAPTVTETAEPATRAVPVAAQPVAVEPAVLEPAPASVSLPTPVAEAVAAVAEPVVSLEERIRLAAYRRYEARGHAAGSPLEDWVEAEREVHGQHA